MRFVGINANAASTNAQDCFEHMVARMEEHRFPWVYLHDESQVSAVTARATPVIAPTRPAPPARDTSLMRLRPGRRSS